MQTQDWSKLALSKIAAIEFDTSDRWYLLSTIARCCPQQPIYYWNLAYEHFQLYSAFSKLEPTKIEVGNNPLAVYRHVNHPAIFILEKWQEIDRQLSFELKNFYYEIQSYHQQIFIVDSYLDIPINLYAIVQNYRLGIPYLKEIRTMIGAAQGKTIKDKAQIDEIANTAFGLCRGEISRLLKEHQNDSKALVRQMAQYKIYKLERQGLKIAPKPDVTNAGGLEAIDADIEKIKVLFTSEAKYRGLRPPKACLLGGTPGTGKTLISKLMGKKLNAQLVACDWSKLIDVNLAQSLANLQYVLDIVDNIGNCILFFDEFEKAYTGWESKENGGVLAKMAGILLTWMQDHESPVIMLATINHLHLLSPEIIRRFEYFWFFDSNLHRGAMYEVFSIHIAKHFPDLASPIPDVLWHSIFSQYRGCSPAEIGSAVSKTHHELFCQEKHKCVNPELLKNALIEQRKNFTPASHNKVVAEAMAKIKRECRTARPVRGADTSRFAVKSYELLEQKLLSDAELKKLTDIKYEQLYENSMEFGANEDLSF